ncbi:MAG: DUF1501 domain-containing protein [Gemmataceae bacterium]
MLSLHDSSGRFNRRAFLGVGSLALGGLALPSLRAATPSAMHDGKSVIFLFMHGGPSQIETFDPKLGAPAEVRSATGEVATVLPGVTFGGTFPKLARLANKLAVVRSFVTGDGNHDIKPVVGRDSFGANLGCVYAHVAGMNHPVTGMPTNVALFPQAVEPKSQPAQAGFGNFLASGPFGSAAAPFVPGGGGDLQRDMKLTLPADRLDDRRALLNRLDRVKSALDDALRDGLDGARAQALRVLVSTIGEAFDLSREDDRTVARYDTAPLVRPDNIDKKWKNYNFYIDNARTIGRLLLLARRLCERGAGFVTVTTNFVWDMHADVNNAPCAEGMRYMGVPFDHAVSAFVEDIEQRGLSDKILLVCCGEMGRTPKLNKNGGRDHWGNLAPLLLAGGGLKIGQVIGQSARNGGEPASEPVRIRNLIATILHTLFDVGQLRVRRGLPRDVQQMLEWEPIAGLI